MVRRPSDWHTSSHRESSVARSLKAWAFREKVPCQAIETGISALSIFPSYTDSSQDQQELQWYRWWLDQQLATLPSIFHNCLPDSAITPQPEFTARFVEVFVEAAKSFKAQSEPSIDHTIEHLVTEKFLQPISAGNDMRLYRSFVFAILGWQTMLYRPSFGTSPPQQLAIVDDFEGCQNQCFLAFKQDLSSAKRPLKDFLLGFGLLIPPKNTCISEDTEERQAFESITTVEPEDLNADVLDSIAHINISWVDTLALHLEFNKATNTLFLFRYPSFCAANLRIDSSTDSTKGVIHGCASNNEVTDFLQEVLLSYRLLFGQSKAGRQFYRRSSSFAPTDDNHPSEGQDPLLPTLCGRKSTGFFLSTKERTVYRLARDFPMLRCRIASLSKQVASTKPRGWKELWRDKRDSAQWVTFWAVIIIGGFGLFLSLLQVILAFVQVAQSR